MNWQYYMQRCFLPSSCHQVCLWVTDKGLGSWSAIQRPPICFHSGECWGSFKNYFAGSFLLALLLYSTRVCFYKFRKMWCQKQQQLQGRNPALKNKSFQSFPGVCVCRKIPHAQSNTAGVVLGCAFNWASEMGMSFIFLSYWCSVGSVMFQFRASSSSVWSSWKCQGFPRSGSCFLSDYWRKKHGQGLPGTLKRKPKHKVIFRSDFLKCLPKKLSLSALHKNEPGNQILI